MRQTTPVPLVSKRSVMIMKFDFDEYNFQDEINLMNLNRQMESQQIKTNLNPSIGFNEDTIYHTIEKDNI